MAFIRTIRIIKCPDFPAPLYVKEALINLKVPIAMIAKEEPEGITQLFTNLPLKGGYKGAYAVEQTVLIEALRKVSPEAFRWWLGQEFPKEGAYFVFKRDEAREEYPLHLSN